METRPLNRELQVERLLVKVYRDRNAMGSSAAKQVADRIRALQKEQRCVRMIFAAAPSQNEFLHYLVLAEGIDWERITAFHLDEYVGLPGTSENSFQRYLRDHLFSRVNPGQVHYLDGSTSDPLLECQRYESLLVDNPIDITCLGIGENGHLAFNDPPVANFLDPRAVKIVELDEVCRRQQVNDGCFSSLEYVPRYAMTITIPVIMSSRYIYGIVPGTSKAEAVRRMVEGPVAASCPASVLRRHLRAILFLDNDSASLLEGWSTPK